MDPEVARTIAQRSHAGQRDRFGEPRFDHVERIAAAVPAQAGSVAFLHDVVEHSDLTSADLAAAGLDPAGVEAVELLTRAPRESYEAHTLRIAHAGGAAGRLARTVKLADLTDHLGHAALPEGAPPYAWARREVAAARARLDLQPAG
jgi:(p)ppGpp synthase/HD superfamily hydrolase